MTSIMVFAARMPTAFGSFYGKLARLDKKLQLPLQTAVLIREQVASMMRWVRTKIGTPSW